MIENYNALYNKAIQIKSKYENYLKFVRGEE